MSSFFLGLTRIPSTGRRKRSALWLLAALVSVQCNEVNAPDREEEVGQNDIGPTLTGLIASGPALAADVAISGSSSLGITYVSLPPGTLPLALAVEISNRTQNAPPVRVAIVDGGFDPVQIQASADDRLQVTVFGPAGITAVYAATVPKRRPPAIVRTNPPRGRTDVATKVRPTVVFSEPMDGATLSTASLRLLENGALVAGTVELSASAGWIAEFAPAAPLKPGTTYQLVITQDVRDLDGDALETPMIVEFTVASNPLDAILVGRIAFVSVVSDAIEYVYIANADGSSVRRLADNQNGWFSKPRWSPDGRRIAISRGESGSIYNIYVVDVDGSATWTRVGNGWDPAWSPDGNKIVFTSRDETDDPWAAFSIHVMNADGSGVLRLTSPNDTTQCREGASANDFRPDWSPDGRRIVFERRFNVSDDGGVDCGLDGWGYMPQLFVVNADGTGSGRLLSDGAMDPAWSPDGQLIAYTAECCELTVIDGHGVGPARQPFNDGNYGPGHHFSPTWSPDGKHLLFRNVARNISRPDDDLLMIELASGDVLPLNFQGVTGVVAELSWGSPPR